MIYKKIINKVAEEVGLSPILITKIYKTYWEAVKEHITSLPLKEDLTEEEFTAIQPNVTIPSIGKLAVTYGKYKAMKNRYKKVQELKEKENASYKENKTSIHIDSDDRGQI